MNRFLGYSIMGIGLLAFFYFKNYKGTAIPLKELWFILSLIIIFAGGYFIAKDKLQKLNHNPTDKSFDRLAEIEQLKLNGDKVKVTLDNAEVKSRTYHNEIISDSTPSRTEMLDALYDSNRNYKTEEIRQTYIVYYKQYNGKNYKFISHATTQDPEVVKMFIDRQNGIDLYIDPANPEKYYFDLSFV